MDKVTIKVSDKGPYAVTGNFELIDAEGNRFETKEKIYICRCGLSGKKPFCDGSHKNNFEDCARAAQVL